jgi:hypothetical protein
MRAQYDLKYKVFLIKYSLSPRSASTTGDFPATFKSVSVLALTNIANPALLVNMRTASAVAFRSSATDTSVSPRSTLSPEPSSKRPSPYARKATKDLTEDEKLARRAQQNRTSQKAFRQRQKQSVRHSLVSFLFASSCNTC